MVLINEYTFRVLQSFTNRDSILLRFNSSQDITPDEFILKIIRRMTRESLMNIHKLDITQYCEHETQILPFINECEGVLDIHKNTPLSTLFNNIRLNLLENYQERCIN